MNSVLNLEIADEDKLLILKRQIKIVEDNIQEEQERLEKLEEGCSITILDNIIKEIDVILEEENAINNRDVFIKKYIKLTYDGLGSEEGMKYYKKKRKWIMKPGKLCEGTHVTGGKISYKEFFDNQEYIGSNHYGHPIEKPYELYYKLSPILKTILKTIQVLEKKNKIYEYRLEKIDSRFENQNIELDTLNKRILFLKKEQDKIKNPVIKSHLGGVLH